MCEHFCLWRGSSTFVGSKNIFYVKIVYLYQLLSHKSMLDAHSIRQYRALRKKRNTFNHLARQGYSTVDVVRNLLSGKVSIFLQNNAWTRDTFNRIICTRTKNWLSDQFGFLYVKCLCWLSRYFSVVLEVEKHASFHFFVRSLWVL